MTKRLNACFLDPAGRISNQFSQNVEIDRSSLRLVPKKTLRQPFTPENPSLIGQKNELAPTYDASTKVFVRIKPDNSERKEGCKIVQKITSDTLSIVGRAYCFDSIIDSTSSQIKDDAKNAVQVENLNEVYVNTVEEVTQLLVKGLSNRKVGSTSVNSRSSRSHIIFTCVVESWCKEIGQHSIKLSHLDDDVKVPPLTKCLLTNILQDNLGEMAKLH
ncbi:hypothetical protein HPP92_027367 [Vanilla planifolia]|uniref:Kinesin motor domain-containing protein n=1 Tax=Vanilla planifolia TaxID=51239 RepID=A0A835PBA1_VANPL|nr:hypothetical protein HPP92_027367 [Vanilla planifolia]